MLPKIIIITLNWNGSEDTIELIKSLKKITYGNFQIIIVDNNSIPSEFEKLKILNNSKVQIISLKENLGFASGNNIGISAALEQNADFVMIINNDTIVEEKFLEPLIDKLNLEPEVGIVAPQINYFDEPDKIWSAGGKISMIRGSGFADSDKLETKLKQMDELVDFVSGCCMLIKREVIQNIGLFDENFFLYTEDTDFCHRVTKAGYKIYVTTKSKIFHKVNRSTKDNFSALPLYYTTRNRLYFSKKNFYKFYLLTVLYISTTMLIKSFFWTIVGNFKNVSAVYRAFKDFFSGVMGKTDHNFYTR